jgi:quercetin dioxygenase-like cupin family protein
MQPLDLLALGSSLPVDKDHTLREVNKGSLLLINLKPQESYPPETHTVPETIIALQGRFSLHTVDGAQEIPQGSAITVPPGVEHRFGGDSDALILVVFGEA